MNENPGVNFQAQVFSMVSKKLREVWPEAELSISDNVKKGPIDIIASLKRHAKGLGLAHDTAAIIEEKIFLECKDYARRLSLDATGKAFCFALIERPDYLIIVSQNGLQPQALSSAHSLFECAQISNIYLHNKTKRIIPLSTVKFFHYTVDQLKGKKVEAAQKIKKNSSLGPTISLYSWELLETKPHRNMIANSEKEKLSSVWVNQNSNYNFRINLELVGLNIKTICTVEFYLVDRTKKQLKMNLSTADISMNTSMKLECNFRGKEVASPKIFEAVRLRIKTSNGIVELSFPTPTIKCIEDKLILGNLRTKSEKNILNIAKKDRETRVFIIEGPGGIGKSFLSKNICTEFSENFGFEIVDVKLHRVSPLFFVNMIAIELANLYTNSEGSLGNILLELIKDRGKEKLHTETLLAFCSQILSNIKNPVVFWFQDCHEASSDVLGLIVQLVFSQNAKSLKNQRYVFEYRSEKDPSLSWESFVDSLLQSHDLKLLRVKVEEITKIELRRAFSKVVSQDYLDEFSASVFNKTGGNPLYVEQVIRHFETNNYLNLQYINGKVKYNITDIRGIRKELNRCDNNITEFLLRRLNSLLLKYETSKEAFIQHHSRTLLWLLSLSPFPPSLNQMAKILLQDEEIIKDVFRFLISENIITTRSIHSQPQFIHDLMRVSAENLTLKNKSTKFIMRYIDICKDKSSIDCLNIGNAWKRSFDYLEASKWFDTGQEAASKKLYHIQRLNLDGLNNALHHLGYAEFSDKTKHLDVKFSLGWAEFQSGSKNDSRVIYESARKLASWPFLSNHYETSLIEKHYIQKALHMLITVDVELLDIKSALGNIHAVFKEIDDPDLMFHISNRLLLILMFLNEANIGSSIASRCYQLGKISKNPDAVSVIMSDLGSLYFSEFPDFATSLWETGLTEAKGARQRIHSSINISVINLLNDACSFEQDTILLIDEIRALELDGQLARVHLLRGVYFVRKKLYGKAEFEFKASLNYSILGDQRLFRWTAKHNLVIVTHILSKGKNVSRHLEELENELHRFCIGIKNLSISVRRISTIFNNMSNSLGLAVFNNSEINFLSPKYSGPMIVLFESTKYLCKFLKGYSRLGSYPGNRDHYKRSAHYLRVSNEFGCIFS